MPREQVSGTDLSYYLIAFDANGRERTDDPDGLMSAVIQSALTNEGITDVFLISHGWSGDVPAARRQYGNWIRAMYDCQADRERMKQVRPGFRPLIIGIHWPSLAWGDETLASMESFSTEGPVSVEPLVEAYAQRIADTPRARDALRKILTTARDCPPPERLPDDIQEAYRILDQETGLKENGEGARPGDDREVFDAEAIYEISQPEGVSFGAFDSDSWLTPLRTLSFWQMKSRACYVGEHGAGDLFRNLINASDDSVRFHLMGHSFGCILVSSLVAGVNGQDQLPRPVDSLALIQGALSLWTYCSSIPAYPSRKGYFQRLIGERRVDGPIIATMSTHDLALGNWYSWGAWAARQVEFVPGELPTYGAVGAWGVRGPGLELEDMDMLGKDETYTFQPFTVYNLESSHVIKVREGPAGAHNDIAKPEVAHAVWSAAIGE